MCAIAAKSIARRSRRSGISIPFNVNIRSLTLSLPRADLLEEFAKLPLGKLEQIEKLEQLRVLEAGYTIACDVTEDPTIGVDTPEDAKKFEELLTD